MNYSNFKLFALFVAILCVVSCGGSSDNAKDPRIAEIQRAIEAANAKEAEARTLGVDIPCDQVQQCSNLIFLNPSNCSNQYYKAYSLISNTATEAKAAADQQNILASYAQGLNPPRPDNPCLRGYPFEPKLACVVNKCLVAQ
jgi:hypothetical protein